MEKRSYNLSKQETSYYCLPAIIQAVLRKHKREESQKSIADALKCTKENGITFDINFLNFFQNRNLDFYYFHHNEVPMREPEFIVDDWISQGKDLFVASLVEDKHRHTRLAVDYDGKNLTLIDPKDCQEYSENLEKLYDHMCRTNVGVFGLVRILEKK